MKISCCCTVLSDVGQKAYTSSPGHSCWICLQGGCPPGTPAGRRCNGPSNGLQWPNLADARKAKDKKIQE